MIAVQNVSKYLGRKELFQGVSFHLHSSDKVGLIGVNGAGKTTLFHLLLGETEPDTGILTKSRNLRMGYLPQQWTPSEEKTVLAHAMDIHEEIPAIRAELDAVHRMISEETDPQRIAEYTYHQAHLMETLEHLGGYDLEARSRKILAGLGFRDETLHRPVSSLSGGWIMRLELARLLLSEPDLLLLDEPTNHLDLESLLWLEQYLVHTRSGMMLISHDREFLNRTVQRIFELEQGQLSEYTGNYDRYCEEKAQRQEIQVAAFKNQQDKIRQMERFIERNRYRKSSARRAQSRLKLLDKMEVVENVAEQEGIHFVFPDPPRSGKRVLELAGVHKSYGENPVYQGIDLVIERGDRVALLGSNGAGKTTLLKMLAGVESIDVGTRALGARTVIGYYAQYQWEQLHSDWTVLQEAASIAGQMAQGRLRSLLGSFLFRDDDVLKKISVLSGGEKARLIFCKLLLQRPNLLLLDEPTNHLDIPSRVVLEKALRDFPETICFISHDRHFINAIANRIVVAKGGEIHAFPGNYDDYLGLWKERIEEAPEAGRNPPESGPERKAPESPFRKAQELKKLQATWRNELFRLKKPIQERIYGTEASLSQAHCRLDELNVRLADPGTYQDGTAIQEIQKEYQKCRETIGRLTSEWEEQAMALEELEEAFWKDKERPTEKCDDRDRGSSHPT